MVTPGSARIKLTFLVEAASRGDGVTTACDVLVVNPGYRTHHETTLRIRMVA